MSVTTLSIDSRALANNPLGDPHVRELPVVVPDDLSPGEPVPCVWYLAGYSSLGRGMLAHDPWQEGLEERLRRLRAEGRIGKALVALPDAFTRFGGSQYVSSGAQGDYESYLWDECVAAVEARFSVSGHAVVGKSSGGFGALHAAMVRPGRFRAVACHAGDMGFRLAYAAHLPVLMDAIAKAGSVEAWLARFDETPHKRSGRWFEPMSVLALCAAYSPDPARPHGIALPFDLERWELDEAVLRRWDALDPVRRVERPEVQASLRALELLFVDVGAKDEYHLHLGARALRHRLVAAGVPHEYEEFDDGHRGTSYRLDVSLPKVLRALGSPPRSPSPGPR